MQEKLFLKGNFSGKLVVYQILEEPIPYFCHMFHQNQYRAVNREFWQKSELINVCIYKIHKTPGWDGLYYSNDNVFNVGDCRGNPKHSS